MNQETKDHDADIRAARKSAGMKGMLTGAALAVVVLSAAAYIFSGDDEPTPVVEVPLPANTVRSNEAENIRRYTYSDSDITWMLEFVPEFAPNHVCIITDDRSGIFHKGGFGMTCIYKGEQQ